MEHWEPTLVMMCAKHWLWILCNLGTWIFLYSNSACGIPAEGCLCVRESDKNFLSPNFCCMLPQDSGWSWAEFWANFSKESLCIANINARLYLGYLAQPGAACLLSHHCASGSVALQALCWERDHGCQGMSDCEAASEQKQEFWNPTK